MGLGNCLLGMLGIWVCHGLVYALDTFVSVAFGQRNHAAMFRALGHCMACLLLYYPVACLVFFGMDSILIDYLRQDPEVVRLCGTYVRAAAMPGLLFLYLCEVLRRFFSNIGESGRGNAPFLLITLLHPAWCWLFCARFKLGVLGVGAATSVTFVLYGVSFAVVYHRWGTAFLRETESASVRASVRS